MLMEAILAVSDDVEPRASRELPRFPASGLGQPAGRLVEVGGSRVAPRAPAGRGPPGEDGVRAREFAEGGLGLAPVRVGPFAVRRRGGPVKAAGRFSLPRVAEVLFLGWVYAIHAPAR